MSEIATLAYLMLSASGIPKIPGLVGASEDVLAATHQSRSTRAASRRGQLTHGSRILSSLTLELSPPALELLWRISMARGIVARGHDGLLCLESGDTDEVERASRLRLRCVEGSLLCNQGAADSGRTQGVPHTKSSPFSRAICPAS